MGLLSSIGKAIGSIGSAVVGGIPGAIIDIGSNWIGNELIGKSNAEDAYKMSQKASAAAFERSYGVYKRRYQDTVNDMQLAGLNPILAASSGFNPGNNIQPNTAQAFMAPAPDYRGTRSALELEQAETEQDKQAEITQTIKNKQQDVVESVNRVFKMRAERRLIKANEAKVVQEVKNLIRDYQIKVEVLARTIAETAKTGEEAARVAQQKQVLQKEEKILSLKIKQLQSMSQWYDGAFGDFLGYIKAIADALGLSTVAGAVKSIK